MSKRLITLIHGTFAENAPWTLPGSDFRRRLQAEAGDDLIFEAFSWSGVNAHHARIRAAEELAVLLSRQLKEYPGIKKTIIAHSHGGNVALYALKLLGDKAGEFDLVTLATPFLNSEKRVISRNNLLFSRMHAGLELLKLILIMIATIGGVWMLFQRFDKQHIPAGLVMLLWIVIVPAVVYYALLLDKELEQRYQRLALFQDGILNKISLAPLSRVRLLTIIDRADEVKWWFSKAAPVWEALLKWHNRALWLFGKYMYVLLASCLVFVAIHVVFTAPFSSLIALVARLSFLLAGFGVIVLCNVIWLDISIFLFFTFLKSNVAFLGFEHPEHQLFIKTTPADRPFGYENLQFEELRTRRHGHSLKHGIYDHKEIFPLIARWMTEGSG